MSKSELSKAVKDVQLSSLILKFHRAKTVISSVQKDLRVLTAHLSTAVSLADNAYPAGANPLRILIPKYGTLPTRHHQEMLEELSKAAVQYRTLWDEIEAVEPGLLE